ncbi:hypothetical protein ADICYQ_4106 [Cyclobacterium qasimii M12-11B]|uniref:Uncharacterized protein n=1 Tax=Cyclobacterium qasimii M12-11B TaxID=641524 RepID=S7V9C3_9BACT|nr:hypothetical protein ADICYQ_4106 [Cyclobacterium qasimii M12-11B]
MFEGTILMTNFIYHKFFRLEIPYYLKIKKLIACQTSSLSLFQGSLLQGLATLEK